MREGAVGEQFVSAQKMLDMINVSSSEIFTNFSIK